jgi:hypothetical protein
VLQVLLVIGRKQKEKANRLRNFVHDHHLSGACIMISEYEYLFTVNSWRSSFTLLFW